MCVYSTKPVLPPHPWWVELITLLVMFVVGGAWYALSAAPIRNRF